MAFYSFPLEPSGPFLVGKNAVLLPPVGDVFALWSLLVNGDKVIISIKTNPLTIVCGSVSGKGLKRSNSPAYTGAPGVIIYMEECMSGYAKTIHAYSVASLTRPSQLTDREYEAFARLCTEVALPSAGDDSCENFFPFRISRRRWIDLAQTKEDFAFIRAQAERHPFGEAHGRIHIIMREGNIRIGAAILRIGRDKAFHKSERKIFGKNYYALKHNAVHIARLYASISNVSKQRIYYYLIQCAVEVSDCFFDEPATYVSGVSYDFIPSAIKAGFNADIPIDKYQSIFYWKPKFVTPSSTNKPKDVVYTEFRRLRAARMAQLHWMVITKSSVLHKSVSQKIWLIADTVANRGKWRSIRAGDIVLFSIEGVAIDAVAIVQRTGRELFRGFEMYPLAIFFKAIQWVANPVKIVEESEKLWFKEIRKGGIFPLPVDFAISVIADIKNRERRDKMWVFPNPYLLRERRFSHNESAIFVVQAWALKDTVLPIIADVCASCGFSVTHAEDRQGQVIFEDIWILLNEAEAVIVDFTQMRPNVYLEYGMALVLGKPIIAITQNDADLPSDTPNLKYIKYRGDINASLDLKKYLPRALADTIADFRNLREGAEMSLV